MLMLRIEPIWIVTLGVRWAPHGQMQGLSSTAPKRQMLASSELILDLEKYQQNH